MDESYYLTTHEAALALVATAMKKARLRIDILIINSLIGGILFTPGGMFHVMLQSQLSETFKTNPGFVELLQAACYPIGLFYVVIMGSELFNSNILFFSVGAMRGAVSGVDLVISWIVSWWGNLVGNIFVCYIICHYSHVFSTERMVAGSQYLVEYKASFSFVETLLKAIAGNFFVCLAIYLQIMVKPLHVKLLMLFLPIFTFVGIGFTHSVADMFVMVMGLINGAPVSVGKVAWKVLLPGAIGNMIGGSFFGIAIPWFSHIYMVEQDQKLLNLPTYELRDEQPEINQDSRVVRQKAHEPTYLDEKNSTGASDFELATQQPHANPQQYIPTDHSDLVSHLSGISRTTTRASRATHIARSPKNVFPVYGMGAPLSHEKSIASGDRKSAEDEEDLDDELDDNEDASSTGAELIGERLQKAITRGFGRKKGDLERTAATDIRRRSSAFLPAAGRHFSISSRKSARSDRAQFERAMSQAGISQRSMARSDEIAGSVPGSFAAMNTHDSRISPASKEEVDISESNSNILRDYSPKRTQ